MFGTAALTLAGAVLARIPPPDADLVAARRRGRLARRFVRAVLDAEGARNHARRRRLALEVLQAGVALANLGIDPDPLVKYALDHLDHQTPEAARGTRDLP